MYVRRKISAKFENFNIINQFHNKLNEPSDELTNSTRPFEEKQRFILIDIPFCVENEKAKKPFLRRLNQFTHNNKTIIDLLTLGLCI